MSSPDPSPRPGHGAQRGAAGRPAVFLDRDGTLVEEIPYLHRPEDVVLAPQAGAALGRLRRAGFLLVVVSNQGGVARGFYDEAAVHAVNRRIADLLSEHNVRVDAWRHCPHHPDGVVQALARACACRKPSPGMLLDASDALGIDLASSFLVGNALTDIAAARAAGVAPIFLRQGEGFGIETGETPAVDDLAAAATLILGAPRRTKVGEGWAR